MPLQDEYQVKLDAFCGPLDLLLFLIRRAELDIHDIPIAQITDQYLSFLRHVDDIDMESAGDFLVMAATLMEIKSRSLMPPGEGEEGPEGTDLAPAAALDPRFELVKQLIEYQRYRIAAEELDRRRRDFARQFPLRPPRGEESPQESPELELEDAHVYDLFETYGRIMASIDFARMGDHRVEVDDTPAALYQEDLLDRLRRAAGGRLTLQELFEERSRVQRLGLFLAMLELVRLRRIVVRQEDLLGEIALELLQGSDEATERRSDEGKGRDIIAPRA
jgi:segregation and condensation protein A